MSRQITAVLGGETREMGIVQFVVARCVLGLQAEGITEEEEAVDAVMEIFGPVSAALSAQGWFTHEELSEALAEEETDGLMDEIEDYLKGRDQ